MKILTIHSDYIEIEPKKKAINSAEAIEDGYTKIGDCLVVFTSVEKDDEKDISLVSAKLVQEIEDILAQINEKTVVLYPYAHLSSDLAGPEAAVQVLKISEELLRNKQYNVVRAPFGWYKAFKISCKGHPLSELSRHILAEEDQIKREEIVSKIESKYYILTPDGEEYTINLNDVEHVKSILKKVNNFPLEKYIHAEELKGFSHVEPPSIKAMQQLELIDYAPESDAGHFKYFPKGKLIFDLLCDWAAEIALNRLSAIEIDTPILYSWDDPEIREQGQSFHERHYNVFGSDSKKKMILRFAGDFGLFKMIKKANISYKNLPLRIYEFSKSFRYEKTGELTGLRRLRGFHMPDIHCFTANIDKGWEEYQELYRNYDDLAKGTGVEYTVVFRIVDTFYAKNKEKIIDLIKYSKTPAFIETLSSMKHYWAVKHEFQGIDSVGGNCQLSTVQLDVKDSDTYGLKYTDKDGLKKPFIIVHSSLGSIERWIFTILENAFKKEKHMIPIWLAPIQIRLIPVKNEGSILDFCNGLANYFEANNIRVDIDDLDETLPKKIREAEKDWIPFIIAVGNKEIESQIFPVRIREDSQMKNMKKEEIAALLSEKARGMPFRKLTLPRLLSKKPIFR